MTGFIMFILETLRTLLGVYIWIVIIRVIASWFGPNPFNPIFRFIFGVTDPLLWRIKRAMPARFFSMGIDFSPWILVIAIILLQYFLSQIEFYLK